MKIKPMESRIAMIGLRYIRFLSVAFVMVNAARAADDAGPPAIQPKPIFPVSPNHRFEGQIVATGAAPITYTSDSLPPSLRIDPASGRITGRSPAPGVYWLTVTASNALATGTATLRIISKEGGFYDTTTENPFALKNTFLTQAPERKACPTFAEAKPLLPSPSWQGHDAVIQCYWKAWEIAFRHLQTPPTGSPFVSNLIDPAFNGCTFMWDSAFMMMFGHYGERAFHFQGTLDNFYTMQHRDGYICREIAISDGDEHFAPWDNSSTGPNILPWAEWEYYHQTGDKARLARIFPALLAYTQWYQKYRSWPDGTYFSSGWGCGMDNQPRLPAGFNPLYDNGFLSWVDTTLQAIFADKVLIKMAAALGRDKDVEPLRQEADRLGPFVNAHLWDGATGFYYDRFRDGSLSKVKSIAAYWALLAGVVPKENLPRFLAHLSNPAEFARPDPIPSLSADSKTYQPSGGYWRGSVWSPTDYMVLRGLTETGADALAHDIAIKHLQNVVDVFQNTGSLWENYAPETADPGKPARKDFVGWTGLSPISILFEYVFGLHPNAPQRELLWDVRLLEAHGVDNYPFGPNCMLELKCAARQFETDTPVITAKTSEPITLRVKWTGGERVMDLRP
jgi:hypothetical protein